MTTTVDGRSDIDIERDVDLDLERAESDARVVRRGIHLLVELVRTNPWTASASIGGSFLFAAASVAGAIILGRVTDDVIVGTGRPPTVRAVMVAGAVIVGMSMARAVGVVARRYFGLMTTRRMQMHWFDSLTDHYLDQPMPFFHGQPTGKLLAHAATDAERAANAMQPLPMSLGAVVLLVFASVNLAVLDPLLLLIGLLLFPSLIILNQRYSRTVVDPSRRAQEELGVVSALAHESFEGALVVKLLGLEEHEIHRMEQAADRLRDESLAIGRLRSNFEPSLDALPSLGTIALLGVGAWRVSEGAITTGDLVQAMFLFSMLAFPMRVVGFLLQELPRAVVSRDRIVEVLASDHRAEEDPLHRGPDDPQPLPLGPLPVEVDGVSFGYGADLVLESVTFDLEPGAVVALVGSTGSGKSTLCSLVAGLARPTGGEIRFGGVPLPRAVRSDVRDAISLVFQETFLFGDSVRANLTLGLDVPDDEIAQALAVAQAGFVDRLSAGLDTTVGERGVTLSGGQRQRLALARALLRKPRVLLLDDATSAIDPLVEARILEGLRTALDTTTLVVAHRIATISLADHVLFLDGGRVADRGTHAELLVANEAYAALVRAYEESDDADDDDDADGIDVTTRGDDDRA